MIENVLSFQSPKLNLCVSEDRNNHNLRKSHLRADCQDADCSGAWQLKQSMKHETVTLNKPEVSGHQMCEDVIQAHAADLFLLKTVTCKWKLLLLVSGNIPLVDLETMQVLRKFTCNYFMFRCFFTGGALVPVTVPLF